MKLTVITVVYNSIEMFKKTYFCLSQQTCQNFTWIIKDGCSDDGLELFINEIKGEFKELVYINKTDNGIYNAMNQALDTDQLEEGLVTFLNAGDIYSSNLTLEKVLSLYNKSAGVIAIPVSVAGKEIQQTLITGYIVNNICHQATFYNISCPIVKNTLKFDERYLLCADFALLIKLSLSTDIHYLTQVPPVIYETSGISSIRVYKRLYEKAVIIYSSDLLLINKLFSLLAILKGGVLHVFNRNSIK
ncbi:glycosyltransferase [Escherichia coli]|nr:glycosyltransferase [Escherichia coli]